MADRPEPSGIPAELAIAVPDPKWHIDHSGSRCRRKSCEATAVAAMNRGRRHPRLHKTVDSWWSYCADHLYGRWIEDGQVMHWIRKPEEYPSVVVGEGTQ